jgi:hypothetical protein
MPPSRSIICCYPSLRGTDAEALRFSSVASLVNSHFLFKLTPRELRADGRGEQITRIAKASWRRSDMAAPWSFG